jgi:hypothetical protein
VSEQQTGLSGINGTGEADVPEAVARRRPGEPHPYMVQRNPPNLWILVGLTALSLLLTFLVLAVTIVL